MHYSAALNYLDAFLSAQIEAYDPAAPYHPNLHPSRPTSWPDGPDYDFPWMNPCDDKGAFQVLDIGGGFQVLLKRTKATLGRGRMDEYAWSVYLLDVYRRATFCLARTYFRSPDIQMLFNWTSEHRDRLWVLELLRSSLERGQVVRAVHLPVLVPGTWSGEGGEQLYHVIVYNGPGRLDGEEGKTRVNAEVLEVFNAQRHRYNQ